MRGTASCCPGKGASFRLDQLVRAARDQSATIVDFERARIIKAGKGTGISSVELLAKAASPFRKEAAALRKAESQFQATQAKAESDFLARIQEAINKQLASFKVPQAQQTPMIESESQVKQVQQSPTSLIPLAIIGAVFAWVGLKELQNSEEH